MAGIASKAKNLGPRNKTKMFFRTRENDSSKACENKRTATQCALRWGGNEIQNTTT